MVLAGPAAARADVAEVDTTHALYHEAPTRTRMTVYNPAVSASATPVDALTVRAGYEADVVSGASVSVKAGAAYQAANAGADVISTASVRDLRHVGRGGFTLRGAQSQVTGGYSYSTENDYKSHAIDISARTDVLDHNTQLEIAYAKNFDRVCDRVQGAGEQATRFRALEDSTGCFDAGQALRTTRPVDVDGFQGSWSQAWTKIFVTQAVFAAQVVHGFQSNPYRSVILGQGLRAQEHVPADRARQSLTVRANVYFRPLRAALRLGARGYVDSWDVRGVTGEAELEKYVGERLRVTLRGRVYAQTGALFFSDDYTGGDRPLGPKGQYFTGDRELSPFTSYSGGLRANYALAASSGRVLGAFTSLRFGAAFDVVQFAYSEFTLGGVPFGNARSYLGSLSLSAVF